MYFAYFIPYLHHVKSIKCVIPETTVGFHTSILVARANNSNTHIVHFAETTGKYDKIIGRVVLNE